MADNRTFEENILKLNYIIKEIENSETKLDVALDLYKEAAEIISDCNKRLNNAQLTVKEITDNFNNDLVGE